MPPRLFRILLFFNKEFKIPTSSSMNSLYFLIKNLILRSKMITEISEKIRVSKNTFA